jgi:hypothetical protein
MGKVRQVLYKVYSVNVRGDEYGSPEQKQGVFVAYTPDYKYAVIETTYGEIIHVPIDRIRFLHPQEIV